MDTTGEKTNVGEKPGYIYEISAELGNTRNISLRGNFPMGADLGHINDELDKIIKAITRQQAKTCLPNERAKLRQMERQLASMVKNSEINEAKYKNHKTLPGTALLEKENEITRINEQRVLIKEHEQTIEDLSQEVD